MKRNVLFILLLFSAFNIWATELPTMLVLSTMSGEVKIPISTIQKITYDKDATTMYVVTSSGTQNYSVADISQMTLGNGAATRLNQLMDSPVNQLTKVTKDGVVYVVKDGKIYTLKGEQK